MFGFFNVDKPLGMTSHDVVAKIRRAYGIKKVGHAGTLDPLASGVLVICVGGATRLSDYVMHGIKTYRARVRFGVTTTTYDAEGDIVTQAPVDHLTREHVLAILPRFTGEIDQVPPMYSAIKQGGKKLYDLARAGVEVEREARRVTINSLELIDWSPPEGTLEVTCSAGTYIRSLAYDIGAALGVGAHLSGLTRTRSGVFLLENAVKLDVLLAAHDATFLTSPEQALTDFPRVDLTDAEADHLIHGRTIPSKEADGITAMGYNPHGRLLAVLESRDERWHPAKVFMNEPHSI